MGGSKREMREIWRDGETERCEMEKIKIESKRRRRETLKNGSLFGTVEKKRLFLAIKKSCEWLCSAQVMEVMPGWGLCSFHHKAPSGILARPRLSRPLAL